MGQFTRIKREQVFQDDQVQVMHDLITFPDGETRQRTVVLRPAAVAAVCVNEAGQVALVRQWRPPVDRYLYELPAGKLDVVGEDARTGLLRELAEETRLQAANLVELATLDMSAGWLDERITIYLATDLRPAPRPADFVLEAEEADMAVLWVPLNEALGMTLDGQITDAKTIAGLHLATARLHHG